MSRRSGKIDVQGPDAAEFLNRVYVNGFAKLPVGKARYGVMLNDDGLVLDDGTTTRLSRDALLHDHDDGAGRRGDVLAGVPAADGLDRSARCMSASLSDEWAAMAVSGPKAREALELAFPATISATSGCRYMGCLEIALEGVPVRIIRLSFSGELAYEVYMPADYGIALWEHILDRRRPLGIKPYGLEALASLRIEKGHVAGLELDHRTSLDDLGLGKMASKEKSYVGRELRQRPELQAPERWSLVGLECLEPDKRLRGGSILFAAGDEIRGPWPRLHHLGHLVDRAEQIHRPRPLPGRPRSMRARRSSAPIR